MCCVMLHMDRAQNNPAVLPSCGVTSVLWYLCPQPGDTAGLGHPVLSIPISGFAGSN